MISIFPAIVPWQRATEDLGSTNSSCRPALARFERLAAAVAVVSWFLLVVPTAAQAAAFEHQSETSESQVLAAVAPSPSPSKEELERLKLEQEIVKLENENEQATSAWSWVLQLAPLVTVLVGVVTVALAFWKQSHDLVLSRNAAEETAIKARDELARQKKTDAEAAEKIRLGRFDESLSRISAQLASENRGLALNGAAALGIFTKPLYADLHVDLLTIVLANLKQSPERAVADLLRTHLASVLASIFKGPARSDLPTTVDLSHLDLYQLDIEGLRFPPETAVDLAFSTLKAANFTEIVMKRARGYDITLDSARFSRSVLDESRFNHAKANKTPVNFHEASLISATFDDSQLPRAEFQRARLQGAKFRRADLRGARFEAATMADAYFQGAMLDEAALRSIAKSAGDWRAAHFDAAVRQRLQQISEQQT